jgi:hypothetical protein
MNCLLRRIGLTVACEGIFIISKGNPRAPRRPEALHFHVFVGETDSWTYPR